MLSSLVVIGQNEPPELVDKVIPEYHLTHGFNGRFGQASKSVDFSINKDVIVLKQNKIRLGMGLRLNMANVKNMAFTEAHNDLPKQDDYDTLFVGKLRGGSLNLELHGDYYVKPKLAIGLNIDLIGVSASFSNTGDYRPTATSQQMRHLAQSDVSAHLTRANAFSFTNAKGSLNSQLYVRYEVLRRISIFGGLGYQLQEVSTDTGYGPHSSYRFQNNGLTWVAGLRINRFDEK